jgi:hypothetical protein
MADRTPGPWKAVYVGCSDWDLDGPTTKEDWTLAAAAPDLLDALQAIVKSLSDQDDEGLIEHAQQMIDARAAIAKATGEQS